MALDSGDESFSVSGGGTLEAKTYEGIEFSLENLGVSSMAVGSILYPKANTVTAQRMTGNPDISRIPCPMRRSAESFMTG